MAAAKSIGKGVTVDPLFLVLQGSRLIFYLLYAAPKYKTPGPSPVAITARPVPTLPLADLNPLLHCHILPLRTPAAVLSTQNGFSISHCPTFAYGCTRHIPRTASSSTVRRSLRSSRPFKYDNTHGPRLQYERDAYAATQRHWPDWILKLPLFMASIWHCIQEGSFTQ